MPKLTKIEGHENLYRHPGSGIIYLRGSYPGLGEVVRSTGVITVREARKRVLELEREILKFDPNYRPATFKEVAEEYFNVKQQEWRDSTVENARDVIFNRLIPEFGSLPPEGVNRRAWAEYAARFYRETPGGFLANTRKYLVGIMNYAKTEGFVKDDIEGRRWGKAKLYPINDPESREGMFIPAEHFVRLIAVSHPLLKVFTYMGYYMGMRPGEILKLERDRVNLGKRSIVLRAMDVKTGSTTGEGREIAIAPEVLPVLCGWMTLVESPWIFPAEDGGGPYANIRPVWKRAVERAKLPDYNPNDLRHTFITRKVLVENESPMKVALYVGNSVSVIEERYVHDKFHQTRGIVEKPAAVTPSPAASSARGTAAPPTPAAPVDAASLMPVIAGVARPKGNSDNFRKAVD
jgi:integrase